MSEPRYEYYVEWDYNPYGGSSFREHQIYASPQALIWAHKRFAEKSRQSPIMKRRLIAEWEDMH